MPKKNVEHKIYVQMDNAFSSLNRLLSGYTNSVILQTFLFDSMKSLFYANLIYNFFHNLNRKNINEAKLPSGKIKIIKKNYENILNDAKAVIKYSLRGKRIDEKYYSTFKSNLKKQFPEFIKLISEIEREIDIEKAKNYLDKKSEEFKNIGKPKTDLNVFFVTSMLEVYVQKEKNLPMGKKLEKLLKIGTEKVIPKFSQGVSKILKQNTSEMLNEQRQYQKAFEIRLYLRWKEPLDLLESLIRISLESGEQKKNKLAIGIGSTNNFKRDALIKIHARAIQISNEILTLLKSGYADGANARWRSLHEIAVISFFLRENNNEVSERYLEHEIIKKFKEAKDYQAYYKKLGYPPIRRKEFNKIKKIRDNLIQKYGNEFGNKDYGWIPKAILANPNFRSLEKHVKIDRLRPFYNLSSSAVHGGSKGFYRLGLMENQQNKILLAGPTNYGLADPIQNTAISLLHVTTSLLTSEPDFESLIHLEVMNNYIKEIGPKTVRIQKSLEKEERIEQKNKQLSKFRPDLKQFL